MSDLIKAIVRVAEMEEENQRLKKGHWVWAEVYVTSDPYPEENPNPHCFTRVFLPENQHE